MNDSLNSRKWVLVTSEEKLSEYFCSETMLNLSRKILSDTEIKVLRKDLDLAPVQRKINKLEIRRDFEEFCRSVRTKW